MAKKHNPDHAAQAEAQTEPQAPKRLSIGIQGIDFSLAPRYHAGHTLNEVEASTLNQTLAENLRNNFAKTVKGTIEAWAKENGEAPLGEDVKAGLHSKFAEYAAAYEFHGRRQAAPPADPVEREARKMASAIVNEALNKKKIDKKTLPDGRFDELVDGLLAKTPAIREEAKRRTEAAKHTAAAALENLLGDG